MGDTPFIKFYPSDFLAGASGLSPSERGVYITLLCLIYEKDGAIQRDDARLSRQCGAPKAAFVRILAALISEGKITEVDGMLSNRRAEKALSDRQIRVENARNAAHQKWTAEGGKSEGNQGGNDAGAMPAHSGGICGEDAIPELDPELDIKEEAKASLSSGDDAKAETERAVAMFNATAEAQGWPQVRVLSKQRQAALKGRLREIGGLDGWQDALARAAASDHLNGKNDRGWTCNFDFLTRQSSFAKLMEGNYDNRQPERRSKGDERLEAAMRAAERFDREKELRLAGGTDYNTSEPLLHPGHPRYAIGGSDG